MKLKRVTKVTKSDPVNAPSVVKSEQSTVLLQEVASGTNDSPKSYSLSDLYGGCIPWPRCGEGSGGLR